MAEVRERAKANFENTVNLKGRLTRLTPETLFKWNYINCMQPALSHAQASAGPATAAGHKAPMIWRGTNGEMYMTELTRIGATTAAIQTPVIEGTVPATDTGTTAAGLNMEFDQDTAADLGWEMNFGSVMGDGTAFTVGTHEGHIDLTVFVTDWSEYDAVSIGFRAVEPVQVGHAPIIGAGTGDPLYTDFVTFGLQEPDLLQFASDIANGGTGVYTNSTQTPTDSQNQRFRVAINKAGLVTYSLEQNAEAGAGTLAAPTAVPTAAYSFVQGATIIPYITVHGRTHVSEALLIKDIEVARSPGTSYQD